MKFFTTLCKKEIYYTYVENFKIKRVAIEPIFLNYINYSTKNYQNRPSTTIYDFHRGLFSLSMLTNMKRWVANLRLHTTQSTL